MWWTHSLLIKRHRTTRTTSTVFNWNVLWIKHVADFLSSMGSHPCQVIRRRRSEHGPVLKQNIPYDNFIFLKNKSRSEHDFLLGKLWNEQNDPQNRKMRHQMKPSISRPLHAQMQPSQLFIVAGSSRSFWWETRQIKLKKWSCEVWSQIIVN
jgi:hypothetical protein